MLGNRRDLGVHSGMVGDSLVELVERGVVTNAAKGMDEGVSITGVLFGTDDKLYRFAHRNPAVKLCPVSYTHAFDVLSRLQRYVSINSALEVDLTGQVNAESIGGDYIGAVGGQVDFVRAAGSIAGRRVDHRPAERGQGRHAVAHRRPAERTGDDGAQRRRRRRHRERRGAPARARVQGAREGDDRASSPRRSIAKRWSAKRASCTASELSVGQGDRLLQSARHDDAEPRFESQPDGWVGRRWP